MVQDIFNLLANDMMTGPLAKFATPSHKACYSVGLLSNAVIS
jgi:hypothetical protein